MQTFLPYPDFATSAASLDRMRLGKQRVETMQIMKALLTGRGMGAHHPATLMWRGYELALLDYQLAVCDEWAVVRGYTDTCADKTTDLLVSHDPIGTYLYLDGKRKPKLPWWIGDEGFHLSHQSNLVRKSVEHYGPQFPGVGPELEYVWPSKL